MNKIKGESLKVIKLLNFFKTKNTQIKTIMYKIKHLANAVVNIKMDYYRKF